MSTTVMVVGQLNPKNLPREIVVEGRRFLRSRGLPKLWIIADYREVKARDSGHLYVRANGQFYIDHVDKFNPDWSMGSALLHLLFDVVVTTGGE